MLQVNSAHSSRNKSDISSEYLSLTNVPDMRINNNINTNNKNKTKKRAFNKWSVVAAGGSYNHKANTPIVKRFGDVIASQSLTFSHENISKISFVNKNRVDECSNTLTRALIPLCSPDTTICFIVYSMLVVLRGPPIKYCISLYTTNTRTHTRARDTYEYIATKCFSATLF